MAIQVPSVTNAFGFQHNGDTNRSEDENKKRALGYERYIDTRVTQMDRILNDRMFGFTAGLEEKENI